MKKIFIFLISLIFSYISYTQDTIIYNETINLNSDLSDYINVKVGATDEITLLPGFEYNADNSGTFSAEIYSFALEEPDVINETGGPGGDVGILVGDDGIVGAISGKADVSPTGAAIYSIPIEIPIGNLGLKPSIGVNYNSQTRNSILGYGASLSGISVISAGGKNMFYDGETSGLSSEDDDVRLFWDGQRLVSDEENDGVGLNANTFYTIQESHTEIIKQVSGENIWFKVKTANGYTMEYGNSDDSKMYLNEDTEWIWMINKTYDREGNTVEYQYLKDEEKKQINITKILYGGPESDPVNEVEFIYKEKEEINYATINGVLVIQDIILDSIALTSHGSFYGGYKFEYLSISGNEYLNRLRQYDKDGNYYNQTVFSWDLPTGNLNAASESISVNSGIDFRYFSGNFNGDGFSDLLCIKLDRINFEYKYFLYNGSENGLPSNYNETGNLPRSYLFTNWSMLLNYYSQNNCEAVDPSVPALPSVYNYRDIEDVTVGDFDGDGITELLVKVSEWAGIGEFLPENLNTFDISWIYYEMGDKFCEAEYEFRTNYNLDFSYKTSHFINFDLEVNDVARIRSLSTGKRESDFNLTIPGPDLANKGFAPFGEGDNLYYSNKDLNALTKIPNIIGSNVWGDLNSDGKSDYIKLNAGSYDVYYYSKVNDNFYKKTSSNDSFLGLIDLNGDGVSNIISTSTLTSKDYPLYQLISTEYGFVDNLSEADWNTILNSYNLESEFDAFVIDCTPGGISCRIQFLMSPQFTQVTYTYLLLIKDINSYESGLWLDINLGQLDLEENAQYYTRSIDLTGNGKNELLLIKDGVLQKIFYNFTPVYNSSGPGIEYTWDVINRTDIIGQEIQFGDFNGDGITELISPSSSKLFTFITNNIPSPRIGKVTNGLGNSIEFTYSNLTDPEVYTVGADLEFPFNNVVYPSQVVKSIQKDNGVSDPIAITYKYSDARYHRLGKGFLGFMETMETIETSQNESIIKKTIMDIDPDYLVPYLIKTENYYGENLVSELIMETDFSPLDFDRYRMSISKTTQIDNILDITKTIDFEYYTDGMLKKKTTTVEDELTIIEEITYQSAGWIGDFFTDEIETTYKRGIDITSSITKFDYETVKSRLIQKTEFKGTLRELITKYTVFDDFGNVTKIEVIGKKGSALSTETIIDRKLYSADGRFLLQSIGPEDHTVIFTPDLARGVIDIERAPNGQEQIYEYGPFSRKYKTTYPDQKEELSVVRWVNGQENAPVGALYYSYQVTTGSASVSTFYDGVGRKLRLIQKGFHNETILVDFEYDDDGRLERKSMPYLRGEPPIWTNYSYDDFGRLSSEISPDLTTTSYDYPGLETEVTVSKGSSVKTSRILKNSLGEVIESEDNDGNIVFNTYYPDGKLKETYTSVNQSNIINLSYDIHGNRTSITDPDAGTITTIYDDFGKLVSQTDASANTTTFEYDNLGRITEADYSTSGTISYSYNTETNKSYFGQISSITNADYSIREDYVYDEQFGRLQSHSREIDSKTFEFSYTYDWFGRPFSKTYPSGLSVSYDYNDFGDLKTVKSGSTTVWECNAVNVLGQVTSYSQGNYTSSVDYDNFGLLEGVTTGNVFNMDYVFDDNGNLAFREDILTHQNESFQYDALNRLEQISYEFDGYPQSAGNLSLTYEDGGNISSKSDLANTIVYGDGTAGPHALTSLKNPNPSYQPSDQSISYTNFNKVSSISQQDENGDPINLTYTYGLDNQRIKTVFTRDAVTEKTKYFLDDYEEVTTSSGTKKYHYISGGTGLCAIFVIDDQDNETLYYTLNDHLGSLNGVINAETDVVTYYSYDAWGNPRDNDDWTTKVSSELFADRGFTGHEHLIDFGLINMNGRVYDPMLGRFLSPDPYVQFAGYADNFNRYSYCFNNPLVYTDPDGNNPFLVWLGIAAIKLAVNYIFQVAENKLENKMSWQESVSLNNTSFIIDYQQPLHWSADQQSTVPYDNSYGAGGVMPMIIQKEETYNSIYDFPLLASLDGEWGTIGDYSYNGDIEKYFYEDDIWTNFKKVRYDTNKPDVIGNQLFKALRHSNINGDGLVPLNGIFYGYTYKDFLDGSDIYLSSRVPFNLYYSDKITKAYFNSSLRATSTGNIFNILNWSDPGNEFDFELYGYGKPYIVKGRSTRYGTSNYRWWVEYNDYNDVYKWLGYQ